MIAGQLITMAVRALIAMMAVGILSGQRGEAQSATFQRGEHVRVKASTKPSDPKPSDMVLTIVAVPNDRIRLDDSVVYVNDTPVSGFSQDFLARVARAPERTPQTVPDGHYYVMGEARINQNISEYWGVHSATSLETAR